MANQQAYNAYMQNKGTLAPGQSIVVNKFNVQVERYLSQVRDNLPTYAPGGFAHVYLVRTATPVYNTTHHVLKRIAVANEAMLAEVKKEVDVMRLLKGHPNIVHLIDAAWHQMPNGMYEVFILMEFCPGGGIIDMMNRRLRERLTEAEILQIFVDVCEGVACMHNLRPALLHRDLKVENILQSTSTSYKLCDFGSATTVSRPPATTQEIRALEADLNRHTTLQYRAPEMVDVYSRRPVDEKSDVWALGVLLYKLCYYTTPFEEHGQLAILNVQYKIPPYPVYSPQMNGLIASMLQEHGVRRPSVFEILSHVHRLRGTKSRFKYTIPVPQPLSPRQQTTFKPSPSPTPGRNDLILVPQSNRITMSVSPARGQGISTREKVMEAIAPLRNGEQSSPKEPGTSPTPPNHQHASDALPLRRGRPTTKESETATIKPSNAKPLEHGDGKGWLDGGFGAGGDAWAAPTSNTDGASPGAWHVEGKSPQLSVSKADNLGFGDDFASKIWDSVAGNKSQSHAQLASSSSKASPPLPARSQQPLGINKRTVPNKDAFDGLGLGLSEKPAPTLAEARKLRTGLAIMQSSGFRTNPERPTGTAPRPSPSPRQPLTPQLQLYPSSVSSSTPNFSKVPSPRPSPQSASSTHSHTDGVSAESRFPSLEELDSGFQLPLHSNSFTGVASSRGQEEPVSFTRRNGPLSSPGPGDSGLLKPDSHPRGYHAREGTRSEQVTGVAMRGSQGSSSSDRYGSKAPADSARDSKAGNLETQTGDALKPGLTRKNESFAPVESIPPISKDTSNSTSLSPQMVQNLAPRSLRRKKPKDWLTGEDDLNGSSNVSPSSLLVSPAPGETPVLRDSPSKRASVVQNSAIPIQSAAVAQHDHIRRSPSPSTQISPTLSKFTQSFPPIDGFEDTPRQIPVRRSPVTKRTIGRPRQDNTASSGDEGPEDAVGIVRPARQAQTERRSHRGRQSSVHDLVDLYGGGLPVKDKERETHGVRPAMLDFDSGSQDQKGRSTVAPMKPVKPSPSTTSAATSTRLVPTSASTSTWTRPSGGEQHIIPTSSSTPGPTPSPRSRPQSMFLFPSKSSESYSLPIGQPPPSPALAPPDEARHRTVRRTSISDIVQRYEGIGGVGRSIGSVTSPTTPRASIKLPGLASNDSRSPKKSSTTDKGSILPVPIGDYVPGRRSKTPTEPNISSSTPVIGRPVPIRHHTLQKEPEIISRAQSLKPEPVRIPKFPANSVNAEDSFSRTESGSSSPERPYQGVGKLIDQWQKKTAEAEPPRTVMRGRGTFTAKPSRVAPDSST
ncbi:hypothetical protein DXG01_009745 [Tephrocybe rancida]|nr:hypothetical protein DXG01_009745 [Tephrocybe rancida]